MQNKTNNFYWVQIKSFHKKKLKMNFGIAENASQSITIKRWLIQFKRKLGTCSHAYKSVVGHMKYAILKCLCWPKMVVVSFSKTRSLIIMSLKKNDETDSLFYYKWCQNNLLMVSSIHNWIWFDCYYHFWFDCYFFFWRFIQVKKLISIFLVFKPIP